MSNPPFTDTPHRGDALGRFARMGGTLLLALVIGLALFSSMQGFRWPFLAPKPNRLADVLSMTLERNGIDAATAQYRTLREQGFPGLRESESDTNSLGYKLLGKDEIASAIQVFQLNAETHPTSANAYDSLGEAHLAAGNKALAIESYRRVVALDPKMKTAVFELQRLTHAKRKPYPPILLLHICAGALGILSGAAALLLRKGTRQHAVAGRVFVVSMLSMSAIAATLAFVAPDGEPLNVLMGVFTFYLVATGWWTVRVKQPGIDAMVWGGLLVALGTASGLLRLGMAGGRFAGASLFFGSLALMAALLDLRMILRGGVLGASRILRHVWRVCTALYIAVMSFFLGQSQVFPYAVRKTGLLAAPGVLVAIALIYWLIRLRFSKAYHRASPPKTSLAVGEAAT